MSDCILPFKGILPTLGQDVYIAPNAYVVGDVEIGKGSSIWFNCVVRGDVHIIRIGERTNIQDGTVVHVSRDGHGTHIGNDVTIGHMVMLHDCIIEDGAFIGMSACLLDGAVVEAGAMVAAGALVTPGKRVKAGELWGNRPARYMRDLTDHEKARNAENAPHYVKLARTYLEQ